MRLAASERPKIDQIGLLAQWKNPRFPAIRQEEGFLEEELVPRAVPKPIGKKERPIANRI